MPNTYRRMDMKKTILVIEDDVIFSRSICNWLSKNDMITKSVTMLSAARKHLATKEFDLILADLRLPDGNSTELLRWMHEKNLAVPFLIMTNYGQVENAVEAMQLGAVNYLCKPVRPEKLLDTINKVFSHMKHDMNEFYRGESDKAREMYRQIGLVAAPEISVLLRGASGTGKEHIARELHEQSRRKNKLYITVDCGSILEELAASEFFGHRKGVFTGADSDKTGLFQEADSGTLFLDEIGNLSYKTQMLLLRALQEKRYKPVGSTKERCFDIRLLAATNENLEKAISEGRFREDLFHRLNEFTIWVPRLSECHEDILPLAKFFLKRFSKEYRLAVQGFDRLAVATMEQYGWPGNIRELKNCVRRAMLLAGGGWITATDLNLDPTLKLEENVVLTGKERERQLLLQILERTGNNRARTARELNMSRTTLYEKLKRYGII